MANEKNIGSVKASMEFDVSKAKESLEHLDAQFGKHKQRMARYATDSIKKMNQLKDAIGSNSKQICASLDKISLSMQGAFNGAINTNFAKLLDAMRDQTVLLASSISKVSNGVENLNSKFKGTNSAIGSARNSTIKWFDTTDSLFNSFSKLTFKVFIIEQGVRQIYELFNGMVGPGFQFASSMETLRIGMAGILASTTKMGDAQTTYAQGLEISEKILKRMQIEALRTTMTVQELSEAYQATLAGGLNAGMDLEQVMDLTVAAANAVKSFGLPKQQVIQELRGLISGEAIRPGVDMLGTVLGYTTATVNKLREQGTLYEDIMRRMEGFKMATYDLDTTWAGMLNNMIDGFNKLAGSAVTNLFDNMKRRVKEIRTMFYSLKQEERTYTNERTGKQETRTVTTDIIINKETQKRLTMAYDTIDNFIELLYTLGKVSLPLVAAAFDAIVPSINAFVVFVTRLIQYLGVIPKVIGTMIDWLLQIPSAVLNGIGSVIDTFWMFTMNIIAAKHALKNMAGSISEAVSEYGAFSALLVTTGAAVISVINAIKSLKAQLIAYAATQQTLNGLMIVWNHVMAIGSFKELGILLLEITKITKLATIAQATYNAVVTTSNYVFKIFTGQITLATAMQSAFSLVTKASSAAVTLFNKGLLSSLKSIVLFLAKITMLIAASAVLAAEFIAIAAVVGGLVYVIYKVSDATTIWGQTFQNLWKSASGVLDGLKLKVQAVFASKEESQELTRRAEKAFQESADAWNSATTQFTMDNVKKEIFADVTAIKDKLTNAISFKDIFDPEIDDSKLPKVETLFPPGADKKLKNEIKGIMEKYGDNDSFKFEKKLLKLREDTDKASISMFAGEMKRIQERTLKTETYTKALKNLEKAKISEEGIASQIADLETRNKVLEKINEQYNAESNLIKTKKQLLDFEYKFKDLQDESGDIVTRAFGEYGDIEVKLAKNKELLTNFMAEIDSLTASGKEGADLLNAENYSGGENGAQSMLEKLLKTSPDKLLEEYEKKKNDFATFADFIKAKMAEIAAAEDANTKVQEKWMDLKNKYLQDLALGMGDAVYAWMSGAQDIGQAMRDMVQELLRNALKLLTQWWTIFGIVSAFTDPKTGAMAANKMVLGVSGSSSKLFGKGEWTEKWAEGGLIGGTGSTTGDSKIVAVSPGEYVMRASAVRKLGVGYLDSLNQISAKRPSGVLPPISKVRRRFAEGGYVDDGAYKPQTVSTRGGEGGGGNIVFNMTFQSLNPEAGAEMMKEQLPFIKNAVVSWMRNDTSVRTAARGAVR